MATLTGIRSVQTVKGVATMGRNKLPSIRTLRLMLGGGSFATIAKHLESGRNNTQGSASVQTPAWEISAEIRTVYSGWENLDKKQGGFKNIMSSVRKHYSTDLKVKIVLEILKEEKSVTQLASDHKIHYSQLLKWKKQVMEGLPDLFSDSRTEALKTTHEKEIMALYQEIGQLTTQLAWLKKKSGIA